MEKMNFEEFKDWAGGEIKDWLHESYKDAAVQFHQVEKLGASYTGMTVLPVGENAAPTVNLDEFFHDYLNGQTMDAVMFKMSEMIENNRMQADMGWVTDYDQVKGSLFIRVSNAEENADLLENVPHERIEDLAVTYHIRLDLPQTGLASIMVNDSMLDQYGVSREQLHEDAVRSAEQIFPARLDSMENILFGLMSPGREQGVLHDEPSLGSAMMVLTNRESVNGASALFYPEVMDEAADHFSGNYFILPSSTHEVIMVPADGTVDYRDLEQMVQTINHTQVAPEDRLSDHVYHYDAEERLFERADRHEARMQQKEKQKGKEKEQGKASVLKKLEEKKQEAGALKPERPAPHRKTEHTL